jgi:hypothetical protein
MLSRRASPISPKCHTTRGGRSVWCAPHRAEEMGMFYTALCLSLFGAAYAFLVSLTIF